MRWDAFNNSRAGNWRHDESTGFAVKAVAVYKQVLKINPELIDVHLRLAELYKDQGLVADAAKRNPDWKPAPRRAED